jgi:23S rRNA pseudouridine1911/1915/1917 synthase
MPRIPDWRSYQLEVLYEDNHLLAVNKPAGLPTMGTPADKLTLLDLAKQYVKQRCGKPGNVYLGVMSRLDAPVTGVVLLARTSKAARRLTEQFRAHAVEKVYWALVEGRIEPPAAECLDWIAHTDRHRKMVIVAAGSAGGKEARLAYRRIEARDADSLVEVRLETGRKHQIRLQMARRGHPIVGDRKYGSGREFAAGIALHARRLLVTHPTRGTPVELVAPLPPAWRKQGIADPPTPASDAPGTCPPGESRLT